MWTIEETTLTPLRVQTSRLELVEVTPELAKANLDDVALLARLLDARIPATWPPEHWEPEAIRWLLGLAQRNQHDRGWGAWYVVCREGDGLSSAGAAGAAGPTFRRTLIGTCGVKGPPDAQGVIEVGYGIVSECQRRGFASEATSALIDWALRDARVKMITAETFPHLVPSLGVMRRLGMQMIGDGSEPGVVRYGVTREEWEGVAR